MDVASRHTELKFREGGKVKGLGLDSEWKRLQLKCGPAQPGRYGREAP